MTTLLGMHSRTISSFCLLLTILFALVILQNCDLVSQSVTFVAPGIAERSSAIQKSSYVKCNAFLQLWQPWTRSRSWATHSIPTPSYGSGRTAMPITHTRIITRRSSSLPSTQVTHSTRSTAPSSILSTLQIFVSIAHATNKPFSLVQSLIQQHQTTITEADK